MRAPLLLISAVLLAGAASPALAFDCAKARTPLEKAICADTAAAQADDSMSAVYAVLQGETGKADAPVLLRNQRAWLQRRESVCRDWSKPDPTFDRACLARETQARGRLLAGLAEHEGPGALRFRPSFSERIDPKWKIEVSIAVPQLADGAAAAPGLDELLQATAKAADQPVDNDPRYTYDAGYAITYDSGELVSVVFDIYVDHGGAHGQGVQAAANYSPALGRALKVDDLVDGKGIAALTSRCRALLRQEKLKRGATPDMVDGDLTEQAVADGIRSIEAWQFRGDSVAIHYDAYAIGAYAEGPYDCALPWAEIRRAAKPGAPLPKG
ncbi:lysozyme inhibitor LprI family protein [Inquilinus sp.]|uniref:lysozyme inhibitor LprI family protein n=1 Tax=Inquilinus sp. TaxID=1932117 RepID=UPI0031DEF05B